MPFVEFSVSFQPNAIQNFSVPFDAVKIVKERYGFDMINVSEKEYAKRALFSQSLGERKSGEQILAILKENELKEQEKLKQQQ